MRKDWYSDCSKLTHSLSTSNITAIPEKKDNEGIDVPDCRRTISAPVVRPKDGYLKEEKPRFDPCNSVGFLDLAHSSESQEIISSAREQTDIFSEQKAETESMEDSRETSDTTHMLAHETQYIQLVGFQTPALVCHHCWELGVRT